MEIRCLSLVQLILFAIFVFLLKTGQCAPNNNLQFKEELDYTNDLPKNYLHVKKLENNSKKYIAVRGQLGNDHSEAPKKYMHVHDVNGSTVPRKYLPLLTQQNETYQDTKHNASKKHTHVKRQFDSTDFFAPRRHNLIHRRGEDSEEEEASDNAGEDLDTDKSDVTDPDARDGIDPDAEDTESDNPNSGGSVESHTRRPGWPTDTWTEVMVMFRKDVQPEKLHLNVGKDNIFRLIGKAVESSRQTELQLLKLKELLRKLRHKLDGNGGSEHSDVNININAASPLGITGAVRDRKSSTRGDFLRDVLHSNYARSPSAARENPLSFDDGMNDEMLEAEKRLFIRRGAQFLRDAWYQYTTRPHHQLYERSDEYQNFNKEINKPLDLEKREYITKGIAFLHKAWDQYKLKKYHHL